MTAVFERILEMSLTAAVVIVVIMFIRLLLRKAPRKYSYALWSVAAFRLVCPVSFQAVFSLFSFTKRLDEVSMETIIPDSVVNPTPVVSPGYFDSAPPNTGAPVEIDPDYVFTYYPITTPPAVETPATSINWMEVLAIVWLVGLAALLIYGIISYVRLRRKMGTAILLEGNVWQSDRVQSPFILGFVRPKIYLPFGLNADQQRYVLAHERYHLKRFDHIVRPLSFLILTVHWFNPLVWAAYYLMGRDMEMSCDEKVLSGGESVKAYSTTLLSFAANRRFPSPSPLAFGESGVKGRIKNALNWKKPRTWVTIIAIIVCIVVIVVCAANPKEEESNAYQWTSSATVEKVEPGLYGLRGYAGHGELTDSEKEKLVELLRELPNSAFEKREGHPINMEGACQLSLHDGHYLTYLYPEDQLFLAMLIGDGHGSVEELAEWEIDSNELKAFMYELFDDIVKLEYTPKELTTYVPFSCIYWDHRALGSETVDGGRRYLISDSTVSILDPGGNGGDSSFETLSDWRPLTEEEWAEQFGRDSVTVDISSYTNPMIRDLSDLYQLANMDGQLWIIRKSPLTNGILSIFALTEPLVQWQADLTHDGEEEIISVVYDSQQVRYTALVTDVSGQRLCSWNSGTSHTAWGGIYLYERDGEHYLMTLGPGGNFNTYDLYYSVFSLDRGGLMVILQENGVEYANAPDPTDEDREAIRAFETEVNALLADAIVLLDTVSGEPAYSTPENHITRIWSSGIAPEEQEQSEPLAVWNADLTHDGVRETITLTYQEELGLYTLTVTNAAGETIWTGEASIYHMGNNGIYLYERDGKQYLMQWNPYGSTGGFFYHYEVFSLTESGEAVPLVSNSMEFSVMNEETLLQLDIGALRAFEKEVNALLEDTIVLISTLEGSTHYSTQEVTLCRLWTSMADSWEQRQQEILNSIEPLAVWRADLTHDGVDEAITLSYADTAMEYKLYVTNAAGKVLWIGEASTFHMGYLGYYLYERDGKEYLLEWSTNGWTGTACYYYQVFSLTEEGKEKTLLLNDFSYDTNSVEQILFIDISDMRAYEKEANALLANAVVLIDTNDGQFVLGDPDNPVTRLWESPVDQWEQTQQELISQLPIVMAYMELKQALLSCVEEQVKLRLGDYELAHVQQVEMIPTAAIATNGGDFLYRVVYQPGDYEKSTHRVTWDDQQCFYLITQEDWGEMPGEEDDRWYFVGTLSEEELQSSYNTPDMLDQYDNDPYLAAVVETVNQWRDNQ